MPHLNLPDLVRRAARERAGHVAVRDAETAVTYAELDARSNQVDHGLAELGVAAGERVVYLGRNRLEFLEVLFGATKHGAVLTPLNWRLTADEIALLVGDAQARVVLVDAEFEALVPDGVTTVVLEDGYPAWRDRQPTDDRGRESAADEVVLQAYTSGTTGLAKGVLFTNANYEATLRANDILRFDADSVVMATMPVYHVGGNVWSLFAPLNRATLLVVDSFEPGTIAGLVERFRVTNIALAPAMVSMLIDVYEVDRQDLGSLRAVVYGGQAMTEKALLRAHTTLNIPLIQQFGMTECTGPVTTLEPEDHRGELIASAGRAFPWVELSIRDAATGDPLPAGETGELWIRSEQCTPGYWNRPEETEALYRDGWLRSGDAGRIDERGYLFLTDRITDMIISGGENIYPIEVERVLILHPDVTEVAVVGVPDETWGETVAAFVGLAAGSTVDEEQLIAWCSGRIAGFRRPRKIVVMESLPRNPTGKILRRELRAPYWQGRSRFVG